MFRCRKMLPAVLQILIFVSLLIPTTGMAKNRGEKPVRARDMKEWLQVLSVGCSHHNSGTRPCTVY